MRRLLMPLLVLPLIVAQGCGGREGPSASEAWVGSYTLVSVDGDPVPSTIFEAPNYLVEVTHGTGSVNGDGTYSLSLTIRTSTDGFISTETYASIGRYDRAGNAFVFTDARSKAQVTGVFSGSQFTLTDKRAASTSSGNPSRVS